MEKFRCLNCGVLIINIQRSPSANVDGIRHCISQWISPRNMKDDDRVCNECWNLANAELRKQAMGHQHLCVCCGGSVLKKRSHILNNYTELQSEIYRIVSENVIKGFGHQVKMGHDLICHPCWQRADRTRIKQLSGSATSNSLSSPKPGRLRCVNCTISILRLKKHALAGLDQEILSVIRQWHPNRSVLNTDHICHECFTLIKNGLHQTGHLHTPVYGHQNICVNCGRSLNTARSCILKKSSAKELHVYNVIAEWILPNQIQPDNGVCYACWLRASTYQNSAPSKSRVTSSVCDKVVTDNEAAVLPLPPLEETPRPETRSTPTQPNETIDSITLPGVNQLDEDKSAEREAPQTSKDAPMEVTKCAYSSSTESAPSDTDDLSTLTTYENTQSSAEIQRKEETIERYKAYTIIANVYHYLKREYELMKCQLGEKCDLSSLANILKRTAAATGVTQRAVTAALDTHKLKTSIRSDHSYNLGNTRTSTARSKFKKTGYSASMSRKGRTQSCKRRINKQQEDERDGDGVRPPKRRTATTSLKSKPTNEKQLPSNITAVYSYNMQRKDSIQSYKRRTNNNEQDEESGGEGVRPPKRRTSRNSVSSTPTNEAQLPFPSPIQTRGPEVMETHFKAEPADDECQQTLEHDPLGSESQAPIHCRTPEAIETEFKPEPADDECLQKPEADPLETESSPAALEEPPDSSDASEIEMKLESVDEEYADLCTDYSICDPVLLDMKTEPPLE